MQTLRFFAAGLVSFFAIAPAILASSSDAAPVPLSPDQALLKLSLKLRGNVPAAPERNAFRAAAGPDAAHFHTAYAQKVDEYLATPEFANVVKTAHELWWRLPSGPSTNLAQYVVANDRSYDEIFVRDYVFLSGDEAPAFAQENIATDGPLPGPGEPYRAVRLSESETRFRSIFSNLDFLNTFPDTPTNKNRKRANQIFHDFLCETLAPTPVSNPSPPPPPDGAGSGSGGGSDPHGSDPDCLGCHYRLDPMAQFFNQWRPPLAMGGPTFFDATQTAQGAVIFPGSTRTFPDTTESGLGRVLKTLPEVPRCVARRTWEFIYGPGTRLDDQTLENLTAAFESHGRRLKALVRAAVMHPYFWSTAEPAPINFADMATVVHNCGCHATNQAPHFTPDQYPFLPVAAQNAALLKQMWQAVSGAQGVTRMPPDPRPALSSEMIASFREWISGGALDTNLQPTLNDADIAGILND